MCTQEKVPCFCGVKEGDRWQGYFDVGRYVLSWRPTERSPPCFKSDDPKDTSGWLTGNDIEPMTDCRNAKKWRTSFR